MWFDDVGTTHGYRGRTPLNIPAVAPHHKARYVEHTRKQTTKQKRRGGSREQGARTLCQQVFQPLRDASRLRVERPCPLVPLDGGDLVQVVQHHNRRGVATAGRLGEQQQANRVEGKASTASDPR